MKKHNFMKPYTSFFKLRLKMGMQYRAAALAGLTTQFAWGFLEIFTFHAFYETNPSSFPMSLQATVSYIWLQQAFLTLFAIWFMETEIIDSVSSGNIIYELCRPLSIYQMWFFRNAAYRISRALLRCVPVLLLAFFLPVGFRMEGISDVRNTAFFLISFLLAFLVTLAFSTFVYVLLFFTISPLGLRIMITALFDFFSGSVIPIPFFPQKIQQIMELLPFASMQNVPFRIYNGNIAGSKIIISIELQIFLLLVFFIMGKLLCKKAEQNLVIQGG